MLGKEVSQTYHNNNIRGSSPRGVEEREEEGHVPKVQRLPPDQEGVERHVQVVGGAGEHDGGARDEERVGAGEAAAGLGDGAPHDVEKEEELRPLLGGCGVCVCGWLSLRRA